ncbi:MAG: membrane protein insertase YidC [Planctomycetota bacterium]
MERNNRLLAWLLFGMAIFFFLSSWRQQQSLKEADDRLKRADIATLKERRLSEARKKAEEFAAEHPEITRSEEPPRQRFGLGSMLASDGYQLLVTLDNQGATIERIELVSQSKPGLFDYRSLQSKNISGYLGYLAAEERPGIGLLVNHVPRGSAAELATCVEDPQPKGLVPGDLIVGWEGLDGPATLYQLDKIQNQLAPGKTLELKVQRKAADDSTRDLTFRATLTEQPVAVLRAEDDFATEQVKGNTPYGSCGMTLARIDGQELEEGDRTLFGLERTLQGRWEAKSIEVEGGSGIEFTMPLDSELKLARIDANLELVKRYRLLKAPASQSQRKTPTEWQYHLELTTIVRNRDDKVHEVAIKQEGLNGVSLEGWWYPTKLSPHFFSAPGARDVIYGDYESNYSILMTRELVDYAKRFPTEPDQLLVGPQNSESKRNVKYIGLDTQVFVAAMQPSDSQPDSMQKLYKAKATILNQTFQQPEHFDKTRMQAYNTGFWFQTSSRQLEPGGEWVQSYRIFTGPKSPELLASYHLEEAIEYGWDIFGFFAVRLGWILHFFYYLIGNYGIAIMMLTVLVRSLMFPVSRRMAINGQKMQALQPELAKLRELLKDEPTKMMAAQQMLMKKAGINQLAGCLPAMIQLPIVLGLHKCVSVDVALRQQPLIPGLEWCSNLAGPDMFVDWHQWMPDFIAGRGSGWFGPYLNILPIITITLFIINQKVLMPKATDEQTRMTQQIMMVMTVMLGVMFFKVPAGLCIYFITSSTWSLIERFLIKRYTPQAEIKTLPENVVNEIVNAVSKTPAGQRPSLPSPSASDKPKAKAPKSPETLAELFEPFFRKKTSEASSKPSENTQESKPQRGGKNRPKRPNRPNR